MRSITKGICDCCAKVVDVKWDMRDDPAPETVKIFKKELDDSNLTYRVGFCVECDNEVAYRTF